MKREINWKLVGGDLLLVGYVFVFIRALRMNEVRNVMSSVWLFMSIYYLLTQFSRHLQYWNERKKFY
jgi:hypothetical protein